MSSRIILSSLRTTFLQTCVYSHPNLFLISRNGPPKPPNRSSHLAKRLSDGRRGINAPSIEPWLPVQGRDPAQPGARKLKLGRRQLCTFDKRSSLAQEKGDAERYTSIDAIASDNDRHSSCGTIYDGNLQPNTRTIKRTVISNWVLARGNPTPTRSI